MVDDVYIDVVIQDGGGKVDSYINGEFYQTVTNSARLNYNIGNTFNFVASPNNGYQFEKFCQTGGIICITTNPFSGTITNQIGTLEVYFKQISPDKWKCSDPSTNTCIQGSDGTFNTEAELEAKKLDLFVKTYKLVLSKIPDPVLTTITISPTSANIKVNETQQMTATCKDQNGNDIKCPTLTRNSSEPSVATIDETGKVIGKAKGTAKIDASFE